MSEENGTLRRAGDSLGRFIRDIGFPITVALILLLKLVPAVDELGRKVDRLCILMEARR
jgi:hypothetical protein